MNYIAKKNFNVRTCCAQLIKPIITFLIKLNFIFVTIYKTHHFCGLMTICREGNENKSF